MRKIIRNMARHNMKKIGFYHMNKRKNKRGENIESVFSLNWRKYIFSGK